MNATQTDQQPGLLEGLLRRTLRLGGSDLHLQAGHRPRIRLHGDLVFAHESAEPLGEEDLVAMRAALLDETATTQFAERGVADVAYRDPSGVQWRVHCFTQQRGSGIALRPLAKEAPTLEALGLPREVERLLDIRSGLVLVSGPTGSGKTTTLAALLQRLNQQQHRVVVTLEDPVEYELTSEHSLISQRALGRDVNSFEQGLRDALTERPDVLVVGELRSLEAIRLALSAAESGLLVFATIHAGDAAQTVQRLIQVFPANEQATQREKLAHCLEGVLCQNLLHAREGRGRHPACELLLRTSAVANLVREGRPHELCNCIQTGGDQGMLLMDDSLARLVVTGKVRVEEARAYAHDPRRLPGVTPPRRRAAKTVERRAEPRLVTLALVNVGEFDEVGFKSGLSTGRTADLSPSGARLELDHGLLIGARVMATFALDDQVVEVAATVRSSEEEPEGHVSVGIHFERVEPEAARAIEAYLKLHA